MNRDKGLFGQTFETLFALRNLALAYFVVYSAISIVDTWYEDSWETLAAIAIVGAVFNFFFLCRLLGIPRERQGWRLFAGYAPWHVLLLYVAGFAGLHFLEWVFDPLIAQAEENPLLLLGYLLCALLLILFPPVLCGTVLPARLLRLQASLKEAVFRGVRQSGYLLPRIIGVFLPIIIFEAALAASVYLTGPETLPVTPSGHISSFSLVSLLLSNLIGLLAEAVFMVITANTYLKDLRERGELPAVDADVFS